MDMFLSWSGDRSRQVAKALRDWLPLVLDDVKPWFSGRDIPAGERWNAEVGTRLENTNFGILCLTQDNLQAPWILFEAGALSKALDVGAVCPYLLDIEASEISGPLSQFQAKKAEKTSTLEMLQDVNEKLSTPIDRTRLSRRFDALWPELAEALEKIPKDPQQNRAPVRSEPEILEELVGRIRAMDQRFGKLETQLRHVQRTAAESRNASVHVGRRARSEPELPPPEIKVSIELDLPDKNYERGTDVVIQPANRNDAFFMIAAFLGLEPNAYLDTWFLVDSLTGELLEHEEAVTGIYERFGGGPPSLTVTDEEPF